MLAKQGFTSNKMYSEYVFCKNIEYHSNWAKKEPKIQSLRNKINLTK